MSLICPARIVRLTLYISRRFLRLVSFRAILAISLYSVLAGQACDSTSHQNPVPKTAETPTKALAQSEPEIVGRTIWSGVISGFNISWTKEDLFVKSPTGLETIWAPLAKRGFDEFAADVARTNKDSGESSNNCDYRRDFRILSTVGTIISFQDEEYSDCGGAHPTTYGRFTLIDLARSGEILYGKGEEAMDADLTRLGKIVKLTDYFSEGDILQALLKDRVIREALAEAGISAAPRSLAELPKLFAKDDNYLLTGTELELRPDFLTRFAFHHVEGDNVAVRLNLPSIAFAYRSKEIGILLPIPAALQQPLALAATQRQGFLMRKVPPTVRDQFTRFDFKIGEGARH